MKSHLHYLLLIIIIMILTTNISSKQFVEFFSDYKNNHDEDKINYLYRYWIDSSESKLSLDHWEMRKGSYVQGQYGLVDPSGYVRNVHYEVNGDSGFRTVVRTRTLASRTHQLFHFGRLQPKEPYRHANPIAIVAK